MEEGGLLVSMFNLECKFIIPDILFVEELSELNAHFLDFGLEQRALRAEFMLIAFQMAQSYRHPSRNDLFALSLAKQEECSLLTGDKFLRIAAEKEGVNVYGLGPCRRTAPGGGLPLSGPRNEGPGGNRVISRRIRLCRRQAMMRNASCVENGMILLPVLFFTIAVAGIAGMAALSRRGALAEKRIHLEKTRALYLAHGGVAEALARVAGLSNDARPDGAAHTVNYDYGEAVFMITDTAGMLDVNIASETELHAAFREGGLEEPKELAAALADARAKGHGPPYWPLGSLDRLLLVPGVPPEFSSATTAPAVSMTWSAPGRSPRHTMRSWTCSRYMADRKR